MKIAVIGGRNFNNYELLKSTLDAIPDISEIVSGGAKGTDTLGEKYAREKGIPTKIFKPNWKLGPHAGDLRGIAIIDNADHVVAFWDGQSRGTKYALNYAREKKLTVQVVRLFLLQGFEMSR